MSSWEDDMSAHMLAASNTHPGSQGCVAADYQNHHFCGFLEAKRNLQHKDDFGS